MGQPHNYVVRVYRRGFESLEGLVEDTRTGAQRPFSSIEQLWTLLRGPISRKSGFDPREGQERFDAPPPKIRQGNEEDSD